MKILKGNNLSQKFNDSFIFQDIDIEVNEGEIVSLIGSSGIGKTTLLNILAGLTKPYSGTVMLKNEDITFQSGNVGYMLQKDLLLPFKNTIDNVCLPLELKGISKKDQYELAKPYFSLFNLENSENKYPSELSGGMKQRAAFLRTYLYNNEIMLLDEPFSALDTLTKNDIHNWFKDMTSKLKTSVLFITHDIDEAVYLSNRVYVMKNNDVLKDIIIESNNDESFLLTNEFLEYKKKIISILEE